MSFDEIVDKSELVDQGPNVVVINPKTSVGQLKIDDFGMFEGWMSGTCKV